jgi:hypothetical protein
LPVEDEHLAAWLRLREPADRVARSRRLTGLLAAALPGDTTIGVLDLATGAGSNLRFLTEHLPPRQHWLVVDRSQVLLDELAVRTEEWSAGRGDEVLTGQGWMNVRSQRLDCRIEILRRELGALEDRSMFEGRHLVTASALLDLVSASWMCALASQCRRVGAAALFTITYDGRSACQPAEVEDELVRSLLNEHQRRDKGLGGPAEGPGASACAERAFEEVGFYVRVERSDWNLGPSEAAVQRELVAGWAGAATELAPHRASSIARWQARRLAHIDAGRSHIVVGHQDLLALPS